MGKPSPAPGGVRPHRARLAGAPAGATSEHDSVDATTTLAYVAVLRTLTGQIEVLAARIAEQLALHPDAPIFTNLPRAGKVRAARLIAEIGAAQAQAEGAQAAAEASGTEFDQPSDPQPVRYVNLTIASRSRQSRRVTIGLARAMNTRQLNTRLCQSQGTVTATARTPL
jgi:hypothetical protein